MVTNTVITCITTMTVGEQKLLRSCERVARRSGRLSDLYRTGDTLDADHQA